MITPRPVVPVVEVPRPALLAGGRLRLVHVDAGQVSPVRVARLPLRTTTHHDVVAVPVVDHLDAVHGDRYVGAVHEATGALVPQTQRARPGPRWRSNPLHRDDLPEPATELAGRTVFGGQLAHVFGHALLEVLGRFRPDLDYAAYDHVLLYPNREREEPWVVPDVVRDTLALVEVDASVVHVVHGAAVRCERLDVAPSPVRLTRSADPRLAEVFQRVAGRVAPVGSSAVAGASAPRVYLSRSALASGRRATNEDEVEDVVRRAGFEVVHPQMLPLREQVALVRGADVVAGCDGSALHLAAFARPGTRLLALDTRPTPNQLLINWVTGLDAVHVDVLAGELATRKDEWVADLDRVRDGLAVVLGA